MDKQRRFLFSVIVPVYKTEQYIEETIQSVLDQTVGFEENIQMILVNNATPDKAGDICKRYQERYPENIVYVELSENRGPSGARNAGIPYIQGKYVNFLDSDDKWASDAFEHVAKFLSQHGDEVTVTICRKQYFDDRDGWFYDDKIFFATRICSIWKEPAAAQFWLCSCFLRMDALESLRFDESAKFSEDMKFLNEELLRHEKFGLVKEAVFYYRKRASENMSQSQRQRTEKYWYFELLERSYMYLLRYSMERFGSYVPYIQYVIMQELAWRISQETFPTDLTQDDIAKYRAAIRSLLLKLDDFIICSAPNLWKEYKLACLRLKYGEDIFNQFECRQGKLYFHNLSWCSLEDPSILTIVEHHVERECIVLDGKINFPFPVNCYEVLGRDDSGNTYVIEEYPGDESNIRLALGQPCLVKRCFRLRIPLSGISRISMVIRWGRIERELPLSFGKFSKLTHKLKHSFCKEGKYIFTLQEKGIMVTPEERQAVKRYERELRWELFKLGYKRALTLRLLFPIVRRSLGGKKLWIISDRATRAKDNGEFFFRHLSKHPRRDVIPYFAISQESPDYQRMKRYGKVVPIESFKHQLLYLAADAVLSSTWGRAIEDPLGWHREWVRNLLHYKYIYLDHALTKDNISNDINKHTCNFAMWTTGAQQETASILNYPYGYGPDVPQTTGLARYDALYPAIKTTPEKIILFAPTWRKDLVKHWENDMAAYNPEFAESEFCRFYNALINDERLLTCMRKHGYRGLMQLHPVITVQAEDIQCNDVITLQDSEDSYDREFFKNALVITDYSSIAMDYAYVGRPVIYAQFDKEDFYRTHSYHETYFDYEKDGFGPVCYDYEQTLRAIIHYIENDCTIEAVYAQRREEFFTFIDGKNCERILHKVIAVTGGLTDA